MAAPNTAQTIDAGTNLHLSLFGVCEALFGVDVNLGDRNLLPPNSGRHRIVLADVQKKEELGRVYCQGIEVIVAGEILEHLPNPGLCLTALASLLPSAILIVTVPNALSLTVAADAKRGVETVHCGHVAWYSPRTLQRLLEMTGWHGTTIYALGQPGKRYGVGNAACPSILAESRTA